MGCDSCTTSSPTTSSATTSSPTTVLSSLRSAVPSSLSISVSAAPSISDTAPGCFDNDNIRFDVNHSSGKPKGCKWLRNHPDEIPEKCVEGTGAYLNCKNTCDSCTTSSPTTSSPTTSSPTTFARTSSPTTFATTSSPTTGFFILRS